MNGTARFKARSAATGFSASFAPAPSLPVSLWADRNRILDSSSPEPGPWRTSRTPYLESILNDLGPDSSYERIVLMKSAQCGGTETLLCFTGYVMAHGGGASPML